MAINSDQLNETDTQGRFLKGFQITLDGVDISDIACRNASEEEGWVEVFKILPEPPDLPPSEPLKDQRGFKCNWTEFLGGYMLLDDMTEIRRGTVVITEVPWTE